MQDKATKVGWICLALGLGQGLVTMRLVVITAAYFMANGSPSRPQETQLVCVAMIAICIFLRGIWIFGRLISLWLLITAAHFFIDAPNGQKELFCVLILVNGALLWLFANHTIERIVAWGSEDRNNKSLAALAQQRFEMGALFGVLQFVPGWVQSALLGNPTPVFLGLAVLSAIAYTAEGRRKHLERLPVAVII